MELMRSTFNPRSMASIPKKCSPDMECKAPSFMGQKTDVKKLTNYYNQTMFNKSV